MSETNLLVWRCCLSMWWLSVVSKSVHSTCYTDDTMMLAMSMSVLCSLGSGEHIVLVCGLLCPCGVLLLSVYTHITLSPELQKSHAMGLLMREDKNSEKRACALPSSIFTICHKGWFILDAPPVRLGAWQIWRHCGVVGSLLWVNANPFRVAVYTPFFATEEAWV